MADKKPLNISKPVRTVRSNLSLDEMRDLLWEQGYAVIPKNKIVKLDKSVKYNEFLINNMSNASAAAVLRMIGSDARKHVIDAIYDFVVVKHDADNHVLRAELVVFKDDEK